MKKTDKRPRVKLTLFFYDIFIMMFSAFLMLYLLDAEKAIPFAGLCRTFMLFVVCITAARLLGKTYFQVWRFGGIQSYIRMMFFDFWGFVAFYILSRILPVYHLPSMELVSFACVNLLLSLCMRMSYRYAYKCANHATPKGRFLSLILKLIANYDVPTDKDIKKINVAIIGAGRVGSTLADGLIRNRNSLYKPVCFIDSDKDKIGKTILDLKILPEDTKDQMLLTDYRVQQVIFAVSDMDHNKKRELYEYYTKAGFKVLNYEAPTLENVDEKPTLKEFEVEDLLFRRQQVIVDERTKAYYKDKVILVTGGGGSIGSEICRQLAKMEVKQIIILDIYENCAYDIQQELRIKYGAKLDFQVEICSITNYNALKRVFETYKPQIVINAAAHKHVPLMEHNVIEAIENNIFGCFNVIDLCENYHAERFMMVSTDKAVNPTNVMGATKRFCEMMVQSASIDGVVKYSCTRFGNVLGSAGSVIPLFKRQIAEGGPITITDKRIIRYFMTIPEASQLVLASGAMARNGELFVLDMGEPVKILDLAQNMIRLTGAHNIEIVETGLRPGEKLYEELLVKTEQLTKTDNKLIFIEKDSAVPQDQILKMIQDLEKACKTGDDTKAREALRKAVPTFVKPEEVNNQIK